MKFAFLFILNNNSILYGLSCLFIELDFLNLFLVKIQSMILGKGLHFLFYRLGWAGGILLTIIFSLLDSISMGNMMVPSGASGASSAEANENQEPNHPAPFIEGEGAQPVGVALPAESVASNHSGQAFLDAPGLQEGDQESNNIGNGQIEQEGQEAALNQREDLLNEVRNLNQILQNLFHASGDPMRDSSAIFDVTSRLLDNSLDRNRIEQVVQDLNQFGTQSQWFADALRIKHEVDQDLYLDPDSSDSDL